jgi:hypothetical protein
MDRKHLIKDVRGLLQHSKPSGPGGFNAWLKNRIDRDLFVEIERGLGQRFTSLEFYLFLFPNARCTCITPGCSKPVRFDKHELKYLRYCSAACSWRDPRKIETRRQNELDRSGGLYSNVAQRPEQRERNRKVRMSLSYKQLIKERELERSNGESVDPRSRPDAIAKRVESNRAGELERSKGKRTNSSQRPEVRDKLRDARLNLSIDIEDDLPVPTAIKKKQLPVAPVEPVEALRQRFKNAPKRLSLGGASWLVVEPQNVAIPWLLANGIQAQSIDTSGPSVRAEGHDFEPDLWIERRGLFIDLTSEPPPDNGVISDEIMVKARAALHAGFKYLYLAFLSANEPVAYVHTTRDRKDFRLHTSVENRLPGIIQGYA